MGRSRARRPDVPEPDEPVSAVRDRLVRRGIPLHRLPRITNVVIQLDIGVPRATPPVTDSQIKAEAKTNLETNTTSEAVIDDGSRGLADKLEKVGLVDLKTIAQQVANTDYRPNRFSGLIIRMKKPFYACGLLWKNGKMTVTGTKSFEDAKYAARKFSRQIQRCGIPVNPRDYKIINVVAGCNLEIPVRLEGFHTFWVAKKKQEACFEPELFPGLRFRHRGKIGYPESGLLGLVFPNGKVIFMGGKWPVHVWWVFEDVYHMILDFEVGKKSKLLGEV